jgi:3-oxoacyl-[acyl-carrier protein] reductase
MDLGLSGKRALVAASSSGLGYAIARDLAGQGAVVAMASRNRERIEDAARHIRTEVEDAVVSSSVCDVADDASIQQWVDEASAAMGGIDLVVPNAGGPPYGTFADLSDDDWEVGYRLTLASAVSFARHARPHLGRGAAVLFMTSASVKEPIPNLVLSGVYRAGVAALAKTLALEWGPDGIRVNHLIPGRIATERVMQLDADSASRRRVTVEAVQQASRAAISMGRYGTPDEYANAAVFLLSDAAGYITGATLQVDGGMIRTVM